MPSQLKHEINKIRGVVKDTIQISDDNIALIRESLDNAEIAIKELQSNKIDQSTKINNAIIKAGNALSIANASVKKSGDSMTGWLTSNIISVFHKALISNGIYILDDTGTVIIKLANRTGTAGVNTDTIKELTSNTGVTIDSVLLKDGLLNDGKDALPDRERTLFIPTAHVTTGSNYDSGIGLDANIDEYAIYRFRLPTDFVNLNSVKLLYYPAINIGLPKNVIFDSTVKFGSENELHNVHTNTVNTTSESLDNMNIDSILIPLASFADVTINDNILVKIYRDADHANDDYGWDWILSGLLITYTADM